jgi:hypothetical protein
MDKDFNLTDRAKAWIKGIRAQYVSTPNSDGKAVAESQPHEFKLL